jgi:hypothetical protein
MNTPEVVEPGAPNPGGVIDPLLAMLSGALDGSRPLDPFAVLRSQLESKNDPHATMILRLLEQRRLQEDAMLKRLQEEASTEEEDAAAVDASAAVQEDLQNVQQAVETIYAELDVLRARSAALAAAVGACPACYGDDPLCGTCRGLGSPGWRRPEPGPFRKYVLPAFARARAIDARNAGLMAGQRAAAAPG